MAKSTSLGGGSLTTPSTPTPRRSTKSIEFSPQSPHSPRSRLSVVRTDSSSYVSSAVYVRDPKCGWRPAELQSQDHKLCGEASVLLTPHLDIDYTEEYYKNLKTAAKKKRKSYGSVRSQSSMAIEREKSNNSSSSLRGSASWAPSWSSPSPPRGPSKASAVEKSGLLPSMIPPCPTLSDMDDESVCSAASSVCSTPPAAEPLLNSLDVEQYMTVDLADYDNGELPLQDLDPLGDLIVRNDLSDIPFLNEASILYNLAARHSLEKPYTRAGVVIVAMNPFKWIDGIYSGKKRAQYSDRYVWNRVDTTSSSVPELEPHVYEASSLAYRGLIIEGKDQSILVSGETGAGKTETVKILLSHLATFDASRNISPSFRDLSTSNDSYTQKKNAISPRSLSRKSSSQKYLENINEADQIVKRVIDSNILLEAFGNAKTSRNDNSSRFSKYTKLQFHLKFFGGATPACSLAGSMCETFLLEKSRVVSHEAGLGERTFHIFYQLLAAPEEYKASLWDGLVGRDASSFNYIGAPTTDVIEGMTDARRWEEVYNELKVVGITGDKCATLMRALCVVLQLGNLVFDVCPENEDGSVISSQDELEKLADILGVPMDEIVQALTLRTVVATKDTIKALRSTTNAKETRNALAKEIYAVTFDWLVAAINDATRAEKNYAAKNYEGEPKPESFGLIGLLDLFGFESFEINYFEQLCINHANERLQRKFTEDIFRSVNKEYEFEGIDLSSVVFNDNGNILQLIEGRLGLIDLLNEECLRPKGSDSGFVNKIYANNKKKGSPLYNKRGFQSNEFGIRHYAGKVKYDATNIVMKNMDALPPDVVNCVAKSTNSIIASKFQLRSDAIKTMTSSTLKHQSVWTKFSTQLTKLMDDISTTDTRYVRCVVPNREKKVGLTDLRYTVTQLHYAGVVSAVTISREAFPEKLGIETVVDRFSFMQSAYGKSKYCEEDPSLSNSPEKVTELLNFLLEGLIKSNGDKSPFLCGKTRTYFKAGVLEYLEAKRIMAFDLMATKIQSVVRGQLAKKNMAATVVQCMIRQRLSKKKLEATRKLREKEAARKQREKEASRKLPPGLVRPQLTTDSSVCSTSSTERRKKKRFRSIKKKILFVGMLANITKKSKNKNGRRLSTDSSK